jgi:hypothetical protein
LYWDRHKYYINTFLIDIYLKYEKDKIFLFI